LSIQKIPKDVLDRFEERYRLAAEHTPRVVFSVGETLLKTAEARELRGEFADMAQIEEVARDLFLAGRDPEAYCIVVLYDEEQELSVTLPEDFEGYPVYAWALPRPQEH